VQRKVELSLGHKRVLKGRESLKTLLYFYQQNGPRNS
jgi:hypothetical protein